MIKNLKLIALALLGSFLFSIILVLSGCHSKTITGLVHAEGIVLYQETPLPWSSLSFLPLTVDNSQVRMGSAMTDENGRFKIRTQGEEGILPGEYRVTIEKFIPDSGKNTISEWTKQRSNPDFKEHKPEETLKVVSAIPLKYSNAKNSGLNVVIDPEGNRNITIKFDK